MTPAERKPALDIPNLPEGIEAYDMRVATDSDFELVGDKIIKGTRAGAAAGLIIRPAKGYSFQPLQSFDIKNFTMINGPEGYYMVVKQEDPVQITATLKVTVTNSFDQGIVENVLAALNGLPGFVSLDRT